MLFFHDILSAFLTDFRTASHRAAVCLTPTSRIAHNQNDDFLRLALKKTWMETKTELEEPVTMPYIIGKTRAERGR